ncbi:MAG: ParB N-terminal domain-containing protein [Bacteroidota bacterium]
MAIVASMLSGRQLQPVIFQKLEDSYNIIDGIKRYHAAFELRLGELLAPMLRLTETIKKQ